MNEHAVQPELSPDYFALSAACLTAVAHLALTITEVSSVFIVSACLFWIGFVAVRTWRSPGILRRWGFRTDNLRKASRIPLLFLLLSTVVLAAVGIVRGTFSLPPQLPALLVLYPIWGVVQQFLVLAIVVGNLECVASLKRRPIMLVLIGAVLFGAIHLPNLLLVGGTALLAFLYVPLYLNHRNLWPLGVVHGWVGSLFYLWALGINPWIEHFG